MIAPNLIETGHRSSKKGLYESFYFRGNGLRCGHSFWLKHNFLVYKKSPQALVESILILFDENKKNIKIFKCEEIIPLDQLEKIKTQANNCWENISFEFPNKSFFKIENNKLQGRLFTENGTVSWDFSLSKSSITYFHYPDEKYYRWPFPKKKILTNDIDVTFDGAIICEEQKILDSFKGMNGHNWGTEHAYKYQYANCNQFINQNSAYFDGFSAKILLGGIIKSPFLSSCSLKIDNKWFYFNKMTAIHKHKVKVLNEKNWSVSFVNDEFLLDVQIADEQNDWAHLSYHHPDRKVSVVNNTKFAHGTLQLIRKSDLSLVTELKSNLFELESLIPD